MDKEAVFSTLGECFEDYKQHAGGESSREWMVGALRRQVDPGMSDGDADGVVNGILKGIEDFGTMRESVRGRKTLSVDGVSAEQAKEIEGQIDAYAEVVVEDAESTLQEVRAQGIPVESEGLSAEAKENLRKVAALGAYKAGKNGAFGIEVDAHTAGATGSAFAETADTTAKLLSGKITGAEAKTQIAETGLALVGTIALNRAIDGIALVAKVKFPPLAFAVNAAAQFAKTVVVPQLAAPVMKMIGKAAKEIWNLVRGR